MPNFKGRMNDVFQEGFIKVFHKIEDSAIRTGAPGLEGRITCPNNNAGMALSGFPVDESYRCIHLMTNVPSLLFPDHVVGRFVDYSKTKILPRDALMMASFPDMESALDTVTGFGKKTVIFGAVEFSHIYGNEAIWAEFHTLITKYSHVLLLSDSGSKVRAMIEKKGHESKLRQWFPSLKDNLPPSLNEDKIAIKEFVS